MTREPLFTEKEREKLCFDEYCEDHGIGNEPCSIPKTKEEAEEMETKASKSTSLGTAEPRTASGSIVRSDE